MSRGQRHLGWLSAALCVAAAWQAVGCGTQGDRAVILATTTSLQDSGLLETLLPEFETRAGVRVKTIAVGTGQALQLARRGEADALLAHAPAAELEVLRSGAVTNRHLVMYNDFVIVGPPADPAGARRQPAAAAALGRIAASEALFISRGDESGTHQRERALWRQAGMEPAGAWYQEAGVGMGQTLSLASERRAYTLTDRATFLALRAHLELETMVEHDPELLNLYHVMQVNPERFSKVHAAGGAALVAYLLDPGTQARIGAFGLERFGQPLFVPAAGATAEQVRSGIRQTH